MHRLPVQGRWRDGGLPKAMYPMQDEQRDLVGQGTEELLRRAQCCLARAELATDPDAKAALLEMVAMLEGLAERAKAGERL